MLLDANILIDEIWGEGAPFVWLEEYQRPAISTISWIEVPVGVGVVPAMQSE